MKLDSKIIDGKKPLTPFDTEEAKNYIGKECYFSNDISKFSCITDALTKGALTSIKDNNEPYQHKGILSEFNSIFILPCEWITEEKKYRPYTIEEFCNEGFEIVVFRERDYPSHESHVRYNGYRKYDNNVYKVILGNMSYTLSDLFEDFERFYNGRWFPFGVKK